MRGHKFVQVLLSPSGNHNRNSILNKSLGNSLADSRSGANDENFLVGKGHFALFSFLGLKLELKQIVRTDMRIYIPRMHLHSCQSPRADSEQAQAILDLV